MKRIGIVAHSAEGGALCFLTACREGQELMGPHMHPEIVVSAIPMGASMPGWESGDYDVVARYLSQGVEDVARAGADFFICPDNTAHIVLEQIVDDFPIPGIHIADVISLEMIEHGWKVAGLLGTEWTMTGSVYPDALDRQNLSHLTPESGARSKIHVAIFDELCQGIFSSDAEDHFLKVIDDLGRDGAECVILGCTEIPLIVSDENSSLPVLDSTRLLAKYAVREAVREQPLSHQEGWLLRS